MNRFLKFLVAGLIGIIIMSVVDTGLGIGTSFALVVHDALLMIWGGALLAIMVSK